MTIWNKLSIKTKLISLSLFMTLIIVSVSINSYFRLHHVERDTDRIAENSLPNISTFAEMESSFKSIRIELRTLGLSGLTADQKKQALEKAKEYIKKYQEAEKRYLANDFLPGEQELYD